MHCCIAWLQGKGRRSAAIRSPHKTRETDLPISYQQRPKVPAPGKKAKITATVRQDNMSISATFRTEEQAQAQAIKTQDEIIQAHRCHYQFDRKAALPAGRPCSFAESRAELGEVQYRLYPDTDPNPQAGWTVGHAFTRYEETVTVLKKARKRERPHTPLESAPDRQEEALRCDARGRGRSH